jgi:hypothetical protein
MFGYSKFQTAMWELSHKIGCYRSHQKEEDMSDYEQGYDAGIRIAMFEVSQLLDENWYKKRYFGYHKNAIS